MKMSYMIQKKLIIIYDTFKRPTKCLIMSIKVLISIYAIQVILQSENLFK